MARKISESSPVTPQSAPDRDLKEVKIRVAFCGDPTYRFNIGDEVAYGRHAKTVVTDILFDGKAYIVECTNKHKDTETVVSHAVLWHKIRPLRAPDAEETCFAQNGFNSKIIFMNVTVESLLHYAHGFGLDLDPDYQRGHVWTQEDREYLIDSIFCEADIGKFVFVEKDAANWGESEKLYEVLDGKQRMSAIIDFYENRFPYRGYFYNDLSAHDKFAFRDHKVSLGTLAEADRATILNYFVRLNRAGRVMDREHLEKIEKILEET